MVDRRMANPAFLLSEIFEFDCQHAPPGHGSGVVFQRCVDVRCRNPDCGELPHHAARLVDCWLLNSDGTVGGDLPGILQGASRLVHQLTDSEITVAVISSATLNAVFLAGAWRYSQVRLGGHGWPLTTKTFDDFFINQAKQWDISAEDIGRVRSVVDDAIEQVAANAHGPVEIRIGSDTFDF